MKIFNLFCLMALMAMGFSSASFAAIGSCPNLADLELKADRAIANHTTCKEKLFEMYEQKIPKSRTAEVEATCDNLGAKAREARKAISNCRQRNLGMTPRGFGSYEQ